MSHNQRLRLKTANEELHALQHGHASYYNHLDGQQYHVRQTEAASRLATCQTFNAELKSNLDAAESTLRATRTYIELLKEDHAKQLAAAETKIDELEELCEKGNIARGQLAWRAARMESDEKLIRELRADIQRLQNCQETPQPAERITPPYEILGIYATLVDGKVQAVSFNQERRAQERPTFTKDKEF